MDNKAEIALDYIPLPTILNKNTYTYVLYQKGIRATIYEQWSEDKLIAYEVFKKKVSREKVFKGFVFPAREKFPRNEDFGYSAWTYKNKYNALKKFNEIENAKKK